MPPQGTKGDMNEVRHDVREFSARQCRGILANAFLGNVLDPMKPWKTNAGGLYFGRLFMDLVSDMGVHKTACLLVYFAVSIGSEGSADDARVVRFEHLRCPDADVFERHLTHCGAPILGTRAGEVELHHDTMEAPLDATAFVDFANANYGYGRFISSCTQEEILQVCCPEMNVGMLFIGLIREDEVVNVLRCRRFSGYSGYAHTFQCQSLKAESGIIVQDVLVLDACTRAHYSHGSLLRDVRKAATSFRALLPHSHLNELTSLPSRPIVSTGRWGCGVFGGNPSHKFVQQLIAASLAGVHLRFSTFGNPEGCDSVLKLLQGEPLRVCEAWQRLVACQDLRSFEESRFYGRFRVGMLAWMTWKRATACFFAAVLSVAAAALIKATTDNGHDGRGYA
eukprot:CAMPEP_0119341182 /NCGR_PEP_ID=MMETSP1333-20130426/101807_1 /TAXON_ID=418940 /ORGANISM="Scyphosphaera apsteinii, Strain RCC1455" /LENGTH=394 /DNA_ID=CAMNT_0007353087 /DNA_START=310 /DNA_END=1494 /DNA_ORIENTATION=+